MALKKDETASFVLRFTQKIFNNADGKPEVQWRGHIQHVQGGEEKRFSEFEEVAKFIQTKLADLTLQALEDKSAEDQRGILEKSFDMWKKMAYEGPKIFMETIKDPKKQYAQLQHQVNQMGEMIGQKIEERVGQRLEIDEWRAASKSDYNNLMDMMQRMSENVAALSEKVEALSKKKK